MKITLTPREVLALYGALHQRKLDSTRDVNDDGPLEQVLNRIRSYIVSSLSPKNDSRINPNAALWLEQQQQKIDELSKQNEKLRPTSLFELDFGPLEMNEPNAYPRRPTVKVPHGKFYGMGVKR